MIDGRRKSASSGNSTELDPINRIDPSSKSDSFGSKINRFLVATRVTPNQVTTLGIALALVCAYFIAEGYFWIGVVMITISGLTDFLDGAVARARKMISIRGKFLDSVSDRIIDTFIFGSLSWYLIAHKEGELSLLPLAILAAGFVVSYERAKAESLGMSGKGGLMERAERLIGLGVAISFNGIILVPVLILILALTAVTIIHRFLNIWGQASIIDNADFVYNEWLAYAKERRQKRLESRGPHSQERFRLQRLRKSAEERKDKKDPQSGSKFGFKSSRRSQAGSERIKVARFRANESSSSVFFKRTSKKY